MNGNAVISADPELLRSFAVDGKLPRTAVIVPISACYFQCARAIVRAKLWDAESHVKPGELPTPGSLLEELTEGEIKAAPYDTEWPSRAAKTMW